MPETLNSSRVLIVEDEESVRTAIEAGLEVIGGYEVLSAVDANDGLNVLKDSHVDILLLDLVMPLMDGIEFLGQLNSQSEIDRPEKIVLMTALENPLPEQNMKELGIDLLLPKPFRLNELAAAVGAESPF